MLLRSPIQPIMRPAMAKRTLPTVLQQAISILRRYGTDAHVYLPGIGTLSGLAAGNYLDSAGTTLGTVDNPVGLVVDAVGGINATQSTTAAKPRLERGARNLLLWSNDLSNAAWTKFGTATTPSPSVVNLPANLDRLYCASTLVSGAAYTLACQLSGSGTVKIACSSGSLSESTISLTSTPTIYALNFVAGATSSSPLPVYRDGTTATSVTVGGTALFQGTLTAQQILDNGGIPLTTTAAASNPNAGRYSWAFDGGDSLALGSVPFQMSDDHWVIAGVKNDSSVAASKYVENMGSGGALQAVGALLFSATNNIGAAWIDDAVSVTAIYGAVIPVSTTIIATAVSRSNAKQLRVNGVQSGATDNTVKGATTSTIGTIGALKAATSMHTGSTGPIAFGKGTISDADLLTIERLVSSLTPNAPTF